MTENIEFYSWVFLSVFMPANPDDLRINAVLSLKNTLANIKNHKILHVRIRICKQNYAI